MAQEQSQELREALEIAADYFPDAIIELARVCRAGNKQHNGDNEVLYWDRTISSEHFPKGIGHWSKRGRLDKDETRHTGKASWRALADCQIECEKSGAPIAPAALRAPMSPEVAAAMKRFLLESRAASDDDAVVAAYDAHPGANRPLHQDDGA